MSTDGQAEPSPTMWSDPVVVAKNSPPPLVLGEMALIRRAERSAGWARRARRLWPATVVLLFAVIVAAVLVLLFGPAMSFGH